MRDLVQELEGLRARLRWLVLVRRIATWVAVGMLIVLAAGFADYLLRLPVWMRLGLGVIGLVLAGLRGWRFLRRLGVSSPDLTTLALRLERLIPQASGHLASAVAFARDPGLTQAPVLTRELAARTMEEAAGRLEPQHLAVLIDPTSLRRRLVGMGLVLALTGILFWSAPEAFGIATQRWLNPLGDAQWPHRQELVSLTDRAVAPGNAPLPLAMRLLRGDHDNLRTWVRYRFADSAGQAGEWKLALLSRQAGAEGHSEFHRLIEPQPRASAIEFQFLAGDGESPLQNIALIDPPQLRELVAHVEPPAYATGRLPVQRHDLLNPARPQVTLEIPEGSQVRLEVLAAGRLDMPAAEHPADRLAWLGQAVPGLFDDLEPQLLQQAGFALEVEPVSSDSQLTRMQIRWSMNADRQIHWVLRDRRGLEHEDGRLFAFRKREDRPPGATVLEPVGDEMVLPTARLPLAAEAQDDVGLAQLTLAAGAGEKEWELASGVPAESRGRLESELDLEPLKLQPGSELLVWAVAQDNFELWGRRHEPVRSTPRRLRVVGTAEMLSQIRIDLSQLRERVLRAAEGQKRLREEGQGQTAVAGQQEMARNLEGMQRTAQQVRGRLDRNRLEDGTFREMVRQAEDLLGESAENARQAMDHLGRAAADPSQKAPATRKQQQVENQLRSLADLLDQGRDIFELQQQIAKLAKEQKQIAQDTRQTLPRTLGRSREQLDEAQKQQLDDLSRRQEQLADQTRQTVDRMRSSAAAIQRQSRKAEDQATAEAVRQAADVASAGELDQKMQKAAEEAGQNKLASAQQQQQDSLDVLQQMMEKMQKSDELRRQILERQLLDLARSIRKLRDQQQAQLGRVQAAERLMGLDEPQLALRRNTIQVADQARESGAATAPVVAPLDGATEHQGQAVQLLRAPDPGGESVTGEQQRALEKLDEALKLAEELAKKNQQDQGKQQRQELAEAYQKVLVLQQQVAQRTEGLFNTAAEDRQRKWRVEVVQAGDEQADVRVEMGKLQEKISQTVVYRSVHDQVEIWSQAASAELRQGKLSAQVPFRQKLIVGTIQSLIEALKQPDQEDPFAGDQGGGGGGGGGGSGGQQPPPVPPLAELRLLRARQFTVHTMTRSLQEGTAEDSQKQLMLDELGRQQQELAESGQKLIQSLTRQQVPQNPLPPGDEK